MLIFPVRHHSPTAALQVARLIRARRPRAVLVEGPADATPLIPLLLDAATAPPVAVYAYAAPDAGSGEAGAARAAMWPFCAYSPEYVALRAGYDMGAQLRFCDVPASLSLAWQTAPPDAAGEDPDNPDADAEAPPTYHDFTTALTAAAGFESFEEFWETAFEQEAGQLPEGGYIEVLADFGGKARALDRGRNGRDAVREQHMAAVARAVMAEGIASEDIVLVCGAAHAAAIAAAFEGGAALPDAGALGAIAAELALVPYSYPRLSEQSGYGAGNRAPWYFQQVWELVGDYPAASRRALVLLARYLRQRGHAASLAQAIDANGLACTLAALRGKPGPGVSEVEDAAIACFGQGQPAVVAAALQSIMIGDATGRVTPHAGRTPLQAEFYAQTQRFRIALADTPRRLLLHMAEPHEAAQSVFLHRLTAADIPFARQTEGGLGGRGAAVQGGGLRQLGRVRENWEVQWTPATDAQLIERSAWGSTLAEVCTRLLRQRLASVSRIDEGTAVLLDLALCDLREPFAGALAQCEALAADSGSFPALARAAYHLDTLLAYGSARQLPTAELAELARRLFARAVLHLPSSAVCNDEAAREVEQTLIALYDLVRAGGAAADAAAFWAAVERVVQSELSNPGLRGLALALLEVGGQLPDGELAARLRYWLSAAQEAADNAQLVAGLFTLNRSALVRNRALIGAVTAFLIDLELEQLTPLLPVLRRSLGNLSRAERTYLTETLGAALGLGAGAAARAINLTTDEQAIVREADAAAAAALAGWEERYGIA